MVNRLWNYHFGRGLVVNPSDFGEQGQGPSHPQLLDWLATELVRNHWSLKSIHRLILTSAAYKRSNAFSDECYAKDPENRLLWRRSRRRLEAESIRDSMLAVSGLLQPEMFGPAVYPELPRGMNDKAWTLSKDAEERNRRSIYVSMRRNMKYPLLDAMDLPDLNLACAARSQTTTAPQALMLLNGIVVLDMAREFAGRLIELAGSDAKDQVAIAYRLCYSRAPHQDEMDAAREFLRRQEQLIAARNAEPKELALPERSRAAKALAPIQTAALVDFCHALLNSNEFLYVD
jgi:hypothetical protein